MSDDQEEKQAFESNPLLKDSNDAGQSSGQVMDKPKTGRGRKVLSVVLVIILIAAAAGGMYYWQQQQAKKQAAELQSQIDALKKQVTDAEQKAKDAEAANADDTANWKSYTIAPDKLTFKYPGSWQLKTTSDGYANLTSPNKFLLAFSTGQGLGGNCDADCQSHNLSSQVLADLSYYSQPLYAVVNGLKDDSVYGNKVIRFNVIPTKTCYYNTCYGYTGKNSKVPMIITGGFVDAKGSYIYMDPGKFTNDKDTQEAVEILKTLKYN